MPIFTDPTLIQYVTIPLAFLAAGFVVGFGTQSLLAHLFNPYK